MSKKITHEEVKEAIDKHTWLTGKLADWSGHDWSDLEEKYDFIKNENIIIKYIKQQEKLLNQIKDIINRPYDISSMLEESKRYVEIENLIKELEND